MLEIHFKEADAVDGSPLEIEEVLNSNDNMSLNANVITHLSAGIYEVAGMVTLQATAVSNVGVSLYTNDEKQGNDDHFLAAAIGEILTIPFYTVIEITPAENGEFAKSEFRSMGNPKVLAGTISVKKIV
ncbi:MAG: hypothetical protein KBT06_03480 [Prevotellaceae bacterium]|nr:hypothetical protein [Candidatus Colivivens equi]